MQIVLDIARGFIFYILLVASGTLLGWLILPIAAHGRTMLAIAGGGAILFLGVVVTLSIAAPIK